MNKPRSQNGIRLQDRLRVVHSLYSSEITADIIAIEDEVGMGIADISMERDMGEAYYRILEKHLRQHGCEHDFADVADDGIIE